MITSGGFTAAFDMAVRSGAPKPDISTREALIEALLAAIGYSASVSGTYLARLRLRPTSM